MISWVKLTGLNLLVVLERIHRSTTQNCSTRPPVSTKITKLSGVFLFIFSFANVISGVEGLDFFWLQRDQEESGVRLDVWCLLLRSEQYPRRIQADKVGCDRGAKNLEDGTLVAQNLQQ